VLTRPGTGFEAEVYVLAKEGLADDPTSALDKTTSRQIVDLLHDLAKRQGSAILMVTHDNRHGRYRRSQPGDGRRRIIPTSFANSGSA
jgi:predicted ABC-type transport system involved in lysophospholipase L1 biosynthesis ATPase subunit